VSGSSALERLTHGALRDDGVWVLRVPYHSGSQPVTRTLTRWGPGQLVNA
jgi:hypothetical protein